MDVPSNNDGGNGGGSSGDDTVGSDGVGVGDGVGVLVTRLVVWDPELVWLFVNFNGTNLKVGVLLNGVEVAGLDVSSSLSFSGDSTRQVMQWGGGGGDANGSGNASLASLAGKAVQLKFEAGPGSKFYSFWLSRTKCGESRGFIGGGGPGLDGNSDANGRCS
jgi:hypothetical protein